MRRRCSAAREPRRVSHGTCARTWHRPSCRTLPTACCRGGPPAPRPRQPALSSPRQPAFQGTLICQSPSAVRAERAHDPMRYALPPPRGIRAARSGGAATQQEPHPAARRPPPPASHACRARPAVAQPAASCARRSPSTCPSPSNSARRCTACGLLRPQLHAASVPAPPRGRRICRRRPIGTRGGPAVRAGGGCGPVRGPSGPRPAQPNGEGGGMRPPGAP